MLGIILKDYYESFCIKKNTFSMIFGFGCLFLFSLFFKSFYGLCLVVGVILPLTGCSPLQYSLEQDDISKFDDILLTFPLTKKEIVASKFGSCLAFCAINSVLSFLITLVYVFIHKCTDFKTGLLVLGVGVIFSIAMLAISNIGFFALGNKKGTIIYMALVIIVAFAYAISYWNFDFSWIFKLNFGVLLFLALLLSLGMLYVSYKVCVKIYTKKHS